MSELSYIFDQLNLIGRLGLTIYGGYVGYKILKPLLTQSKDVVDWESIGLKTKSDKTPSLVGKRTIETGKQYLYNLPNGLSISDVKSKQEKLENIFKSKLEITRTNNYLCSIKTITTKYEKCYKIDLHKEMLSGMKYNIGRKLDGKPMVLDLSGSECHTLVCGSTGSGKSVFLNVFVSQCIMKGLELYIIDPKKVEYTLYRDYYNLKTIGVTENEIEEILKELVTIMYHRYDILEAARCKNHTDYNKKHNKKMRPIVCLIDEFSVIDTKSQSYKYLFDLLARSRACNILLVICTQRPSAKVVTGELKCNLKNVVVFRCENQVDSEVALSCKGDYRAFDIKETGVGLLKSCGRVTEFKSYYLTDDEILDQLKIGIDIKKKPIQAMPDKVFTIKEPTPIQNNSTIKVIKDGDDITKIDLL